MTITSRLPSGWTAATTTFFRVSAAVHSPSGFGAASFTASTSVAIVEAPGVTISIGWPKEDESTSTGGTVVTASVLAAYPPAERTKASSPISQGKRNSSLRDPPIAPETAEHMTKGRPSRAKILW